MEDEAAPAATPLVRTLHTRYVRVPNWVVARLAGDEMALAVYIALGTYADSDGRCFPGRKTLAKRMYRSLSVVTRAIARLERKGCLVIEHETDTNGASQPNTYWLLFDEGKLPGGVAVATPPRVASDTPGVAVATPKLEPVELEEPEALRASVPVRKTRARDEVWDTLIEVCGPAPQTTSGRGAWNRAAKELKAIGATPDEIRLRAGNYWPGITITPTSIAKHWTLLGQPVRSTSSAVDERVKNLMRLPDAPPAMPGLPSVRPPVYDVQHIEREHR